jgi:iron(III) transport system substrate-binding protein
MAGSWRHGKRVLRAVLAGLSVLSLLVGSVRETQAQSNWQREWEKVLAAAEKEGQVNIGGPPGDTYRLALMEMFQKRYPKIKVEWDGSSGRDKMPKIVRERETGIFAWDIYVGGSGSPLRVLKPVGAFDPLRPEVISPEVLDDSKWHGGFNAGFVDKEGKFIFAFDATSAEVVHVNWDSVSKNEFKSFKDLLDPKWAGKIVWEDPRSEGSGLNTGLLFLLSYGESYLKKLLGEQKVVFTTDRRQLTEWVVRGRYPIGISVPTDLLDTYQKKGVGKNVKPVDDPTLVDAYTQGFGSVAVFDRRPHPNATKVYLHWLLSKDGQASWASNIAGRNSRRADAPVGQRELLLQPNKKYINTQAEEFIPNRVGIMRLAKEMIRQ